MDFRGRLRLPEDAGSGIPVDLRIEDVYLELWAGTEELGTWRLEVVGAERVNGNLFALNLDGEFMQFLADDPLGFAYEGVGYVEEIGARLRKRKPWKRQAPPTKAKSKKKKKPLLPPPEEPQQSPISRLDSITDGPGFIGSQDRPSVQHPPAAHVDPWVGVDPTPAIPAGSEYASFHEGEQPPTSPDSEGQPDAGFVPFSVGPTDQPGGSRGYVFDPFPQQASEPPHVEPGPAPYQPSEPAQDGPFQPSEPIQGGYPPVSEPPAWGVSSPEVPGVSPPVPAAPQEPGASTPPMAPPVSPVFPDAETPVEVEPETSAQGQIQPTQEGPAVPPEKRSILDRLESAAGRSSRKEEIPEEDHPPVPDASTSVPGVSGPSAPGSSRLGPVDPSTTKEAAERIEHAAERIELAADRIDADVVESPDRYRGVPDSYPSAPTDSEVPGETPWSSVAGDTISEVPDEELVETEIEPDLSAVSRETFEPSTAEEGETPSASVETVGLVEPEIEEPLAEEGSDWAAAAGIEEEIPEWPITPIEPGPQQGEEAGLPEPEGEASREVSTETEEAAAASQEIAPEEAVGEWDAQTDDSLASLDRSFGDELRRLVESMSSTVYDLGPSETIDEEPATAIPADEAQEVPSEQTREPFDAEAPEYSAEEVRAPQEADGGFAEPPASPWAAPALDEGVGGYDDIEVYHQDEPAVQGTEESHGSREQDVHRIEPEPAPPGYWEKEQESLGGEVSTDDWAGHDAVSPWHIPAEGEWVVPTIEATTARPAGLPQPASYRELDEVDETDENALELDRKDRADRAAAGKAGKKRGRRGIHEHNYEVAKTVGGITRLICTECGHLSFHTEDTHQEW